MSAQLKTGVYCWRNKVNGKVYVGSTGRSLRQRKWEHLRDLRRGKHINRYLQHAWNKYGEDNFEWIVLECCPPEDCVTCEQKWIDELHAMDRTYGYNLSPTAGSQLGFKHSDEARAKMSEAQRNRPPASPETRARISAAARKINADPEVKAKISEATRKALADPEFKARHRVATRKALADPEVKAKSSAASLKMRANPEYEVKRLASFKKALASPEAKARKSAASKMSMADPEVKAKQRTSLKKALAERRERQRQERYAELKERRKLYEEQRIQRLAKKRALTTNEGVDNAV